MYISYHCGCALSLCLLLFVPASLVVSSDDTNTNIKRDRKTDADTHWNNPRYILNNRLKRTGSILYPAVLASVRAIKSLTKGAQQVRSVGKFMQFEKSGNMLNSLRDFRAIRPKDLKFLKESEGQYKLTGTVGDSQFTLWPSGRDGKPTIEVRRLEGESKLGKITHEINYTDQ